MFEKILEQVRKTPPLIHCMTNYVTVNDCANLLLAAGGSPIMADAQGEVEEITSICGGLVLNIGTLNERTIPSMLLAGKRANALGHPVVLDPVGAGASKLRTETTFSLVEQVQFSVIRGNSSEIRTVSLGSGTTKGVDADAADATTEENADAVIAYARKLSEKTGAVIAITGAIDVVVDSKNACLIRNGHPAMGRIIGTGCMLTTVIAAYCTANPHQLWKATAAAICAMGICGELAYEEACNPNGTFRGTATLRGGIIDAMSRMEIDTLNRRMKLEVR